MLRAYAAWAEGAAEVDVEAIKQSMNEGGPLEARDLAVDLSVAKAIHSPGEPAAASACILRSDANSLSYQGKTAEPQVRAGQSGHSSHCGHVSLHRGLLVIVRPEAVNPTESPRLVPRHASTGRLSGDLKTVPAVDQRTVTEVVFLEIRSSARWRALPPRHCSVPHYAERRRAADPDSCRPSR